MRIFNENPNAKNHRRHHGPHSLVGEQRQHPQCGNALAGLAEMDPKNETVG
jgi:hypothetical protein